VPEVFSMNTTRRDVWRWGRHQGTHVSVRRIGGRPWCFATLSHVAKSGWWRRSRGPRMRRCSECGYSWPMPQKEHYGHENDGIELTPHLQSAAHLIGQQVLSAAEDNTEVREALSHCPQCGSGHYTEHRGDKT
jgi:hypothetical protein